MCHPNANQTITTNKPTPSFSRAKCSSYCPTNSDRALPVLVNVTVGWAVRRAFGPWKAGCRFVGGDSLISIRVRTELGLPFDGGTWLLGGGLPCLSSPCDASTPSDMDYSKQAVREATTKCPCPVTFWPWKWCPSHVWHGLPMCQF